MKIFLAHASEDKALVRDLHSRLLLHGFKPWLDEVDILPGEEWRIEIPEAIRKSDIFIACLSQQSVQKKGYVQREFRLALETCAERTSGVIFLIPLKFNDCEIPDLELSTLSIKLSNFQSVDFWKDDGFDRLLLSLKKAKGATNLESTAPIQSIPIDSEADDLTLKREARRKFLKQAGLVVIGLLVLAVVGSVILESAAVAPPPEDHNVAQGVTEFAAMSAGATAGVFLCSATGVGATASPACALVGSAVGGAVSLLFQ
jgi:TIR domain